MTPTPNPAAFHAFEHAGWESSVVEYDDAFSQLTSQSIGTLLDSVHTQRGTSLLDLATGPGYVAAAAAGRGAKVTGVDFSAAMLAEARKRNPEIEFREGDAQSLPFPDASFEAVVMNFGMLHMAQPEKAMAEAARVLKPGGHFAFTVWAMPELAKGFGVVLKAVQSHGNMDVPLPPGPPQFRFSDSTEATRTLMASGFNDVKVTIVPQTWRFQTPDALFQAMMTGTVRMKALLRAQTGEAIAAIRSAMAAGCAEFARNGVIEIPMPSVLSTASKPAS